MGGFVFLNFSLNKFLDKIEMITYFTSLISAVLIFRKQLLDNEHKIIDCTNKVDISLSRQVQPQNVDSSLPQNLICAKANTSTR